MWLIKRLGFTMLILLTSLLGNSQLLAQSTSSFSPLASDNQQKLRVGVVLLMPFAQNSNGHYSGIAVDIWSNIAAENHWDYTYIPLPGDNFSDLKRLQKAGDLDIVIGPISVTSARLEKIEFTRPFFLSSVGIVAQKNSVNLPSVLRKFFSRGLVLALSALALSFILYIHILWYIERGKLKDVFNHYYNALTKGIWFHLLRKGFGVPKTFYVRLALTPTAVYSRVASLIWLLLAAALFTTINANYIATMTLDMNDTISKTSSLKSLQNARVAGIIGHASVDVAEKSGIYVQQTASIDQAMALLSKSKVDAVVCDAPLGIEYIQKHPTLNLFMSQLVIQNDELAFALKPNSPLKHRIDISLARMQDNDKIVPICQHYIGSYASRCDM